MTVKVYNKVYVPKINHALSFINSLEHAVQKSGAPDETMRQLAIVGWSEECKETILAAIEEYKVHLREQIEPLKESRVYEK